MTSAPQIFDRQKIATHLNRRDNTERDFVTTILLNDLADRLATISRKFENALILAPEIRHLPKTLRSSDGPIKFAHLPTRIGKPGEMQVDPEKLDLPAQHFDLIISLYDLAITNDVPSFLRNMHRSLKPDGLMMAAFIGGASLTELRQAWLKADATHINGAAARVAPMIGTRDAGGLLQTAGLALPVADIESHIVRYPSPLSLMVELKQLGVGNPLIGTSSGGLVTPQHLASAIAAYAAAASDPDGRIRATLELVWISGWAPHESQQKPLKPGSAKINLKDVLKP